VVLVDMRDVAGIDLLRKGHADAGRERGPGGEGGRGKEAAAREGHERRF
jgi:hypothetical protein